jgi:hypothetical protein
MISKQTAMDIALAYREIETAEKLRADVVAVADRHLRSDLRDVFGRRVDNLELGIPSGDNSRRIFQVPYSLAIPVIDAHIALHRSRVVALNEQARLEMTAGVGSGPETTAHVADGEGES